MGLQFVSVAHYLPPIHSSHLLTCRSLLINTTLIKKTHCITTLLLHDCICYKKFNHNCSTSTFQETGFYCSRFIFYHFPETCTHASDISLLDQSLYQCISFNVCVVNRPCVYLSLFWWMSVYCKLLSRWHKSFFSLLRSSGKKKCSKETEVSEDAASLQCLQMCTERGNSTSDS